MAEGTTIKVGIDASDVKKGLDDTDRKFGQFAKNIGSKLKVGIGGAVAAVAGIGAAMGASFDFFKDLASYTGELEDMSIQTGISMSEMLKWTRAFELAGVPIADASKVISKFKADMQDAAEGETPFRKALNELGYYMEEVNRMEPLDLFQRVITEASGREDRESIMRGAFGGKVGLSMLRLGDDLAKSKASGGASLLDLAASQTSKLGAQMEANAAEIGAMDDQLNTLEMRKRAAQLQAFGGIRSTTGKSGEELGASIADIAETVAIKPAAFAASRSLEMVEAGKMLGTAVDAGMKESTMYLKEISSDVKKKFLGVFGE